MSEIFGRVFSIELDEEPFIEVTEDRQFRVTFEIFIDAQGQNCTGDIAIYNLSNDTAAKAFARGKTIVLRAGYTDTIDIIFKGQIVNILRERTGPDTRTRLLCKSGAPVEMRNTMNRTFGAGSSVIDVIGELGASVGFEVIIDPEEFKDVTPLIRGYPVNGDPYQYLGKLGGEYQFTWVIENDRLVIIRSNQIRTGPIHQISQFTGMEEIPEITGGVGAVGADVRIRLNPKVRINGRFQITSEYATFNTGNLYYTEVPTSVGQGIYNILTIRHSGDNYSSAWSTLLSGSKSVEELKKIEKINGELAWGDAVSAEFRTKIKSIASGLQVNPDWLMAVMAFETGPRQRFSPSVKNPRGSATGLIQFTESTARGLSPPTTTAALAQMTAEKQLDYVASYYRRFSGRMKNLGDAYMAVLWPPGVNKPDSYVLWSAASNPSEYKANKELDIGNKGYVTRADAVSKVNATLQQGYGRKA